MIIHSFNQTCLVVKMLHYYSCEMKKKRKENQAKAMLFFFVQTLQSNRFMFVFLMQIQNTHSHSKNRKIKIKRWMLKFVPDMFHLHWQMKREKKRTGGVKGLESKLHYHRHFHHHHHYQYDHQNQHQHHLQHCDVKIFLYIFGSASDTYSGKRSESDNIHTVCGQLIYSRHLSESYWMILGKKAVMPLLTLKKALKTYSLNQLLLPTDGFLH